MTIVSGDLLHAGRFVLDARGGWGEHVHDDLHQVALCHRGRLLARTGGHRWPMPPGAAVWIPAGTPHDIEALQPSVALSAYLPAAGFGAERVSPVAAVLRPSSLLTGLLEHLTGRDLPADAFTRASRLVPDALEVDDRAGLHPPCPADGPAREVAQALVREPWRTDALSEWARSLHTSSKTLQRAFVATTGMTFTQWRAAARLAAAQPLLAEGLGIAEVASRVGYRSPNGFTAAHRRHLGRSPSAGTRTAPARPPGASAAAG